MSDATLDFLRIDLPAMLAAALAAMTCALLGNFLVLRRLSLMGDAISHAVLPGIIVVFLLFGTRASIPVVLGAAAAGLLTTVLVEAVCRLGRVETGASMGVVFSILFALGVLLLEQAAARSVDLDADCVLYGQLEDILWLAPTGWSSLLDPAALAQAPREVVTLGIVGLATGAFVALFFKELRIAAFDPGLATTLGFSASVMHYALMALVAVAAVASFESVGSILVIAMLICPAAAARMLTDRLLSQIIVSLALGALSAVLGYILAAFGPFWFGGDRSLSASGMIAVVSGAVLAMAILFSPSHGVIARRLRLFNLTINIAREDLLAALYRLEEPDGRPAPRLTPGRAISAIRSGAPHLGALAARLALRRALALEQARVEDGALRLTDRGRAAATTLVRSHRLWETWLVDRLGLRADHVHRPAMDLEHVTNRAMRDELTPAGDSPATDPHNRPIPKG